MYFAKYFTVDENLTVNYTVEKEFLLDILYNYNIQIVQGIFDSTKFYLEQFIAWKQKYAYKMIGPFNKKIFLTG